MPMNRPVTATTVTLLTPTSTDTRSHSRPLNCLPITPRTVRAAKSVQSPSPTIHFADRHAIAPLSPDAADRIPTPAGERVGSLPLGLDDRPGIEVIVALLPLLAGLLHAHRRQFRLPEQEHNCGHDEQREADRRI